MKTEIYEKHGFFGVRCLNCGYDFGTSATGNMYEKLEDAEMEQLEIEKEYIC